MDSSPADALVRALEAIVRVTEEQKAFSEANKGVRDRWATPSSEPRHLADYLPEKFRIEQAGKRLAQQMMFFRGLEAGFLDAQQALMNLYADPDKRAEAQRIFEILRRVREARYGVHREETDQGRAEYRARVEEIEALISDAHDRARALAGK
jgi:hypothetical protein